LKSHPKIEEARKETITAGGKFERQLRNKFSDVRQPAAPMLPKYSTFPFALNNSNEFDAIVFSRIINCVVYVAAGLN